MLKKLRSSSRNRGPICRSPSRRARALNRTPTLTIALGAHVLTLPGFCILARTLQAQEQSTSASASLRSRHGASILNRQCIFVVCSRKIEFLTIPISTGALERLRNSVLAAFLLRGMVQVTADTILTGTANEDGFESHTAEVHVLAVDDSILDRKVIEKLLLTSAYKVTAVDSGNKALEVLGAEGSQGSVCINISLIITDYSMPGMSGYELLKRVKETAALKEIPVVIMSSENIPNRIQRCLEEGAKDFLMKPVQMADVERLKEHIRTPSSTFDKDISSL